MEVYILSDKGFHPVPTPDIEGLIKSNTVFWADMIGPTREHVRLMREVFQFHPLAIEDTVNQRQRPKVEEFGNHFFTILNPISVVDDEIDFRELDVFVGEHFLVTVHDKDEPVIRAVLDQCNAPKHSIPITVGYALYAIADHVVDHYFPILDAIGDEIDELSEKVLEHPNQSDLAKLFRLKRSLTEIWRVVGQQRDMFSILTREDSFVVNDTILRYYIRDVYDHLLRISDTVNTFRDTLSNVMDLYLSSFSNRLNITVKRLTIMTLGIGIMTVISGFYGMNFLQTFPPFESPWGVPFVLLLMAFGLVSLLLYVRKVDR